MTDLAPGVMSDPDVMSGAACVAGRRTLTATIREEFLYGQAIGQISTDYYMKRYEVEAALRYEIRLLLPVSKGGLKPSQRPAKKAE